MTYRLQFLPSALKEWKKLDGSIQSLFKNKLQQRLQNPHVPASRLHSFNNHYKIKLKKADYRLVYEVLDQEICVLVIAVGNRENNPVYKVSVGWASVYLPTSLNLTPIVEVVGNDKPVAYPT